MRHVIGYCSDCMRYVHGGCSSDYCKAQEDKSMSLPPNPKQAYGDKKPNVALVPPALDLYAALALGDGAVKYGPFNWREKSVEVMTYVAAIMRHLGAWVDRQDLSETEAFIAPDGTSYMLGGKPQLAHVAACVAILADAVENGNAIDNRPPKGPSLKIQGDWFGKLPVGVRQTAFEVREEAEQYGKPAYQQAQEMLEEKAADAAERARTSQACRFETGLSHGDSYCLTHFSYECQHKKRVMFGDEPVPVREPEQEPVPVREPDAIDREGERMTAAIRRIRELPGKYEHACPDLDQEYPLCSCMGGRCKAEMSGSQDVHEAGARVTCCKLRAKDDQRFDVV